jgi:predicted SAM-dependent methyltransferase
MPKLNLGCGFDKREGWVNADHFAECEPDLLFNIEDVPWPIADSSYDQILMKHVLEHVGASFADFRAIMQELYRILTPGGLLEIHVPHYRHDTWWSDPTHVRAFTPLTFQMMSKKQNDLWIKAKANYTMLAYVMELDFEVDKAVQVYDPNWYAQVREGKISQEQIRTLAQTQWGVVKELQVVLRAVK